LSSPLAGWNGAPRTASRTPAPAGGAAFAGFVVDFDLEPLQNEFAAFDDLEVP
jgi:hypothetical protein